MTPDFRNALTRAHTRLLGTYLIGRYGEENTTDGATETIVMLGELSDAAELLHALAGDYHPDNVATPDQQ